MIPMLVIATLNQNKFVEFKEMLKGTNIEIKSLADFGPIPKVLEDADTFEKNAYKKAHHTARVLGLPALADDSGLVVEALGGAPGVYSARYAGPDATDEENCVKLLSNLGEERNRNAYFSCFLSIAVPSGPALTYEGRCDGSILYQPRGNSGFGYDPLFYFEEYDKTFAELTMEEKNSVSHRGRALKQVKQELQMITKWLEQRIIEEKPPRPDHSRFAANDWSGDS